MVLAESLASPYLLCYFLEVDIIVRMTKKTEGEVSIPGSKSHTIRGVIIGSLADGISKLKRPLVSADTMASVKGCEHLGAKIYISRDDWTIEGFGGRPCKPDKPLDMANSGTSLNLLTGVVALGDFETILDGDASLRTRPVQPLLNALNALGAKGVSLNNNGCPPVRIKGGIKGGRTVVNGVSSQFVSSLLIATPLAKNDTEIEVVNIHEVPYIEMTLKWLDEQGLRYERNNELTHFEIEGRQRYIPFEKSVPGDWSSATFFLVAGAITESDLLLKGLDVNDVQGDRAVVEYLKRMGADIKIEKEGIRVKGGRLTGTEIDLSNTPDALPAMAVAGCFAEGTTRIYNVAHARIKETDRIEVMGDELAKMNAKVEETEDGLIIQHSELKGTMVNGYYDHRVVMALSLAGLIASGTTEVTTAESVSVTFPNFVELMKKSGANIKMEA
jgi:3-phosphoshikimate 1-carboxyvinyltransferase